jgi:hypothetical protein
VPHLQYRYHVEALPRNPARQIARLNMLGLGGWRLVAVSGGNAYFIHSDHAPDAHVPIPLPAEEPRPALEAPRKQLGEGTREPS